MRLAKATEKDFKLFWSVHRALERMRYPQNYRTTERCEKLIMGRLRQMDGAFTRVVMGCQVLIDNCCDPDKDYYEFSPKIQQGFAALEQKGS